MNIITSIAQRAQTISTPDLRGTTVSLLGSVHARRLFGRLFPLPDDEFQRLAGSVAARTFHSADIFVAIYVAEATGLLKKGYGTPLLFAECEQGEEIGRACYEYSLDVLKELACQACEEFDTGAMPAFTEAFGEAVALGMLWD